MTIKLAETYPDKLVVGMEIRDKVCEFVHQRILALRKMHPGQYLNAAAIKTNAMRTLPNYFNKGQLEKTLLPLP
jgi:tRNA (guanine-N7-)-methyltransferase